VPSSCVLGRPVESCDIPPLLSPLTASPTAVCYAASEVSREYGSSTAGSVFAEGTACPYDRPCVYSNHDKLCNSFIHSWHAPLGVHSAKRRHQSAEWTILSHISCFIQREVIGFQVLLDSFHSRSMRASWWSPPVLQGEAVKILTSV